VSALEGRVGQQQEVVQVAWRLQERLSASVLVWLGSDAWGPGLCGRPWRASTVMHLR
jgi:hypothetical protein